MIAILLSTYNGERFLRQQVDSLLNQGFKNWKLYIRDDGSTDNTISIIQEYTQTHPNKIYLDSSNTDNLGAGKSFMYLLQNTEANYYMFCDQDDVWKTDKIEITFNKILDLEYLHGKETPIGVFTDLEVVDENLATLMPSLWKGDNRNPDFIKDFYQQWTNRHATYGCTLMINKRAKDIVLPYRQFEGIQGGHDNWIEYILIKKGVYDYVDQPTILYRQHGKNVAGANTGYTYSKEVIRLLKNPFKYLKKLKKDFKRSRLMPFKVSFLKILSYRISQSVTSLINR